MIANTLLSGRLFDFAVNWLDLGKSLSPKVVVFGAAERARTFCSLNNVVLLILLHAFRAMSQKL